MKKESFGSPFFMGVCLAIGLGCQVLATAFSAPARPSAARAALRGASPLPHLFGPVPLVPERAAPLSRANTTGLIGTKQM